MNRNAEVRLSVVIPARNAAATIASTVNSIVRQNVPGVEVLVVDDGSSDDLRVPLEPFLQSGPVRLIRQAALGVSVARNRGVEDSAGSFIMFVDSDDRLPDNSLADFLACAVRSEAEITISDFYIARSGSRELIRSMNTERVEFGPEDRSVLQWLTMARVGFGREKNVGLLGAPWAKIYRRSFLEDRVEGKLTFMPDVARGQDVLFNTEAFGIATRVTYWRSPCYEYVVSSSSSSHRSTSDFETKVEALAGFVFDLLRSRRWSDLEPAAHKMVITLLEESLLRRGRALTTGQAHELLTRQPFSSALRGARLRDFSLAGKAKLVVFRAGGAPTWSAVRLISWVRRIRKSA